MNVARVMSGHLLIRALSAGRLIPGYPPFEPLPIIPRQRNPEDPAMIGWLYYKEWRCSIAHSKTDLYFQELFAGPARCAH